MYIRYFQSSVIAFCITQVLACHPKEAPASNVGDSENQDASTPSTRRKRDLTFSQQNLGLGDFFTLCMQSYRRFRPVDIRTIVSFTIDQTRWFEGSDQKFCASDTVACWRNILYSYMTRNSELFNPAIQCIDRYGVYRGRTPGSVTPDQYYAVPGRRYKRHSHTSLPINRQTAATKLRQSFPGYRGDFRSLIEFFQDDVICSPGFCDCTGILLPPGERCGQNWYTKLGAMTRTSSPLRAPLVFVLNSITSAGITQQQRDTRRMRQQRLIYAFLTAHILRRVQPTTVSVTTTVKGITPNTTLPTSGAGR